MHLQKHIGIFQAEWPLQVHTINSAIALAKAGFCVDIFLYRVPVLADICKLNEHHNIAVYNFLGVRQKPYFILVDKIIKKLLRIHKTVFTYLGMEEQLIPFLLLHYTNAITRNKNYQCLIGFEKLGLIWAAKVAKQLDIPCFYHSLELYTRSHPYVKSSKSIQYLKHKEEVYHSLCTTTIIQDNRRAEVLFKENSINKQDVIFVPVSMAGEIITQHSEFINNRFNLPFDCIKILQFGSLNRYGVELTTLAQSFPPDWFLILHDGISSTYWKLFDTINEIKKVNLRNRVILSTELLNQTDILLLIRSATIGLVLYSNKHENDFLTAFSSEKLALYLQCGIPIIAFNYPGYEIIEKYKCGVVVETINDIPNAVQIILASLPEFRINAFHVFSKYYNFDKNYQKVIDKILSLGNCEKVQLE